MTRGTNLFVVNGFNMKNICPIERVWRMKKIYGNLYFCMSYKIKRGAVVKVPKTWV